MSPYQKVSRKNKFFAREPTDNPYTEEYTGAFARRAFRWTLVYKGRSRPSNLASLVEGPITPRTTIDCAETIVADLDFLFGNTVGSKHRSAETGFVAKLLERRWCVNPQNCCFRFPRIDPAVWSLASKIKAVGSLKVISGPLQMDH